MPELLSKRGYFKVGKSKLRLNLLPDESNCLGEGIDDDCTEPILELAQPHNAAISEAGLTNNITQPTENQSREPVLPFRSQEPVLPFQSAINQEDGLFDQYSTTDESLSDGLTNYLGNTQDAANEDQGQIELLDEVAKKFDTDPELANLGEVRGISRYNLREKPIRNKKYYKTELEPDYENNLRGGNDFELNNSTVKHQPNMGQNLKAKSILKPQPIKPKLTISQEISLIECFSKSAKKSLREAFLLQRELKSPISNQKLADFLYRNQFNSDKNTLFHQHTADSIRIYGKKQAKNSGKRVSFSPTCEVTEKKQREVKINLSQIIKSSYYSVSFLEMTLERK